MLKTIAKASKITNLTDARYYAAWEVNYIGFDLERGNDTFIEPHLVKAMKEWLEGPLFVGELGAFPELEATRSIVDHLELDVIQLGTMADLNKVKEMATLGKPIIKEYTWNELSDWESVHASFESMKDFVAYYLLDFSQNGYDIETMEKEISTICQAFPVLLDASFESAKIEHILDNIQPKGLAVKGGEEEKVGYKSFDEVDDIFEALEIFV